jgi:hypothetical protein
LVKREAVFVVAGLYLATAVAGWSRRRRLWPQIGIAALLTILLSASWRIGLVAAGRGDTPTEGYLSFLDAPGRGLDSLRLVASTYLGTHWWLPVMLTMAAVVLALLGGSTSTPIFVGTFVFASLVSSTFVIWSEPFLRISQHLSLNPIVRMTLVVVVVTCPLTALMLEDAWRAGGAPDPEGDRGAIADVSARDVAAWGVLAVAMLAYPVSAVVGIGGPTLPGGRPAFPDPPPGTSRTAAGGRPALPRAIVARPLVGERQRDDQREARVAPGATEMTSPSRTTFVTTKLGLPFASS